MRWRGERESENVEDRRDEGGGFGFPIPGGVRFPSGGSRGGGIGIFGILIILGLMFFFGIDPASFCKAGDQVAMTRASPISGCHNRAQTRPIFRRPASKGRKSSVRKV